MYERILRADLAQALERYSRLVYAIAYSRARNHADAEDIFQEVFLRLAQRREPFDTDEHCKAWLIRVTANLSVNVISSAWRRRVTLKETVPPSPSSATDARSGRLHEALRRLPDRTRTAIVLRYWEGMKTAEIAELLGEKTDTVRKRLLRGKQALREYLTEPEESEVRRNA